MSNHLQSDWNLKGVPNSHWREILKVLSLTDYSIYCTIELIVGFNYFIVVHVVFGQPNLSIMFIVHDYDMHPHRTAVRCGRWR